MRRAKRIFAFVAALLCAAAVWSADLNEAVRLYQRGDFGQAADLLAGLTRTSPGDAGLRLWLGKCFLKTRRWDDAVRELEKAVELAPSSSVHHYWLGRAYGEKASRAVFFKAPGWAKKLRAEFETAVKLSTDYMDARFDLLEFYLQAPGFLGGGHDKAEAQVQEIAGLNPRLGHTARARLYQENKKWDLARQELEKSVKEFPGEPDSFLDLADFLLKRGDPAGAESNARKALGLSAGSPRGRLLLSAAQIQLRKSLPEAEARLRELAAGPLRDEDPSFAEVYYWLGRARAGQGKRAEARQAFETALRYDPEHADAKAALSRLG